jgi:hypothetical protein
MATVQIGSTGAAVVVGFNTISNSGNVQNLATTVTAAPVMVASDTLDMMYNFLARAYDTTGRGRAPRAADRPQWAQARFSVEEIYDVLDHAAREVALSVRSDFLKPLWQTINPSSNAFDQSDKLRLLGSRVKVGSAPDDVIAQKLGIYQFGDITSRGVGWTDTQPVYTNVGGELKVYGDTPTTPNPSDAEATFIKLPEVTTFTSVGTLTGTSQTATFAITTPTDNFDTTRDLHVLAKLSDGSETVWSLISAVSDTSNISLTGIQLLTDMDQGAGAVTITWYVPAFYEMPRILEKLVVQLAAGDLFSSLGEMDMATEAYQQYTDALREFALPQYALPIESEENE